MPEAEHAYTTTPPASALCETPADLAQLDPFGLGGIQPAELTLPERQLIRHAIGKMWAAGASRVGVTFVLTMPHDAANELINCVHAKLERSDVELWEEPSQDAEAAVLFKAANSHMKARTAGARNADRDPAGLPRR